LVAAVAACVAARAAARGDDSNLAPNQIGG